MSSLYPEDWVEDVFRLRRGTLARARYKGEPLLPFVKIGRHIRYRRADVARAANTVIGRKRDRGNVEKAAA